MSVNSLLYVTRQQVFCISIGREFPNCGADIEKGMLPYRLRDVGTYRVLYRVDKRCKVAPVHVVNETPVAG